jgi:hypothetical protein
MTEVKEWKVKNVERRAKPPERLACSNKASLELVSSFIIHN